MNKNLIFLISAPRSGSSLLQQILASSKKIYTLPEPWMMLAFMQAIESEDSNTLYNNKYISINFNNYLNLIGETKYFYLKQVREFGMIFYQKAFEQNSKADYFLDKTPRYYHIIPELKISFPEAKIILLTRNPLAVFASILDYNFKGKITWLSQKDRLADIFKAPKLIADYISDDSILWVKYENLVQQKEIELNRIAEYLGIEDIKSHYELSENFLKSDFKDNKSLHKHSKPVDDYLYSWKKSITTSQKKRLAKEYLEKLGEVIFEKLNYDYSGTLSALQEHKVNKELLTLSLRQTSNNFGKGQSLNQLIISKAKIKTRSLCYKK